MAMPGRSRSIGRAPRGPAAGRVLCATAALACLLLSGATPVYAAPARATPRHPALVASPDLRECPAQPVVLTCVDLSSQRLWVRRGRRLVFGPVPIRTGRVGDATPDGWFTVYYRNKYQWSTPYSVPMPFSQFFYGGDALHGVFGGISQGPGSHGCVNLNYRDAARLWTTIGMGSRVFIWGFKPPVPVSFAGPAEGE
jgi:hypothetical protein